MGEKWMSGPKTSEARLDVSRERKLEEERIKKSYIIYKIKSGEEFFCNSNINITDCDIQKKLNEKFLAYKKNFDKKIKNLSRKAVPNKNVETLEKMGREFENAFSEFKENYEKVFLFFESNLNKIDQNEVFKIKNEIINLIDQISVTGSLQMRLISPKLEKLVNKFLNANRRDISKVEEVKVQDVKLSKQKSLKTFEFSQKNLKNQKNGENEKRKKSEEREERKNKKVDEKTIFLEIEKNVNDVLEELKSFFDSDKFVVKTKNEILYLEKEILKIKDDKKVNFEIKEKLILEEKEIIENRLKDIEIENKKIEKLYNDYLKEVYFLGIEEKKLIKDFLSEEEIKKEIDLLKKKGKEIVKRNYIKEQLDEVMAKHGFNVIDPEEIDGVRKNTEVLYGIDDSTGINVFMTENASLVTLKVIGIGFDDEITDQESERLYQEQCNFCSLHPELLDELRNRGVILEEKKYNKADKRYNSKIRVKNFASDKKSDGKNKRKLRDAVKKKKMYKK